MNTAIAGPIAGMTRTLPDLFGEIRKYLFKRRYYVTIDRETRLYYANQRKLIEGLLKDLECRTNTIKHELKQLHRLERELRAAWTTTRHRSMRTQLEAWIDRVYDERCDLRRALHEQPYAATALAHSAARAQVSGGPDTGR